MELIRMDYDLIIVGAGVAESATAIRARKRGLDVLLVDRGDPIGSKNMSGGVLWGNDLSEILPTGWWEKAPVERYIVLKGLAFLAPEDALAVTMHFPDWSPTKERPANGWSVLRARFDPWLAGQAKEAGCDVFEGINVDELTFTGKKVTGIRQNGEEFSANAVVLAEGTNPRLAEIGRA